MESMRSFRPGERRRGRRALLEADPTARVVIRPPEGPPLDLQMRDLSAAGVSFFLPEGVPEPGVGDTLENSALHLHGEEAPGTLVVMHVSVVAPGARVCGALFYPDGDAALERVQGWIAEGEAGSGGRG